MIELLNKRFVPYYFNRSGNGRGGNTAASKFTLEKTKNQYAFLAAFTPDGEYLGETALYADKHAVLAWLRSLLEKHPAYAAWSETDKRILTKGKAETATSDERFAVVRLYEALGRSEDALAWIEALPAPTAESVRAHLRVLRSTRSWPEHAKTLQRYAALPDKLQQALAADLLAERAYQLNHKKEYKEARALLRAQIKQNSTSARASDLHFALGVACWSLDERDWARFHWMWIWHERREDRLAMRAKIAAVAETMPYPNPELGGFKSSQRIGTGDIEEEHERSCALYARLLPYYASGDWGGPARADEESRLSSDPAVLAARLRDGNSHVAENNKIVDRLVALGAPAIPALVSALNEPSFLGRGYAGWTLGRVMAATDESPLEARVALVRNIQSTNDYVSKLALSGMKAAGLTWDDLKQARDVAKERRAAAHRGAGEVVPWEGSDPAALVKRLRDGNAHRVTNNRIVERLSELGSAAVKPLTTAIRDPGFQGRGYAAYALGRVLSGLEDPPPEAARALREVARTSTGYVRALSTSGLALLRGSK